MDISVTLFSRLSTPRVRCPEVSRALEGIKYIAAVTRAEEESNKVDISRDPG